METVQGVVQSVRKDRRGIQVNDTWYSVYAAADNPANKGDTVKFQFIRKGDFNNVKGKVEVQGGGSVPVSGGGRSSGVSGGSDIGVAVGHAINNAVHLLGKGAKLTEVEALAAEVYKLSVRMKANAAAGKYTDKVPDAADEDDQPF